MVLNKWLISTNSIKYKLVGGIPTPLKNMKVSWDDEIPNIWKNNVPNHQSVMGYCK
jgi:hypothetical protein